MYKWSSGFEDLPAELQHALRSDEITQHPRDMEDFLLCMSQHQGADWCTTAMDSVPRGQGLGNACYLKRLQQLSHAAAIAKKARTDVRLLSLMHALDERYEQPVTKQTDISEQTDTAMKRCRHWSPHHTQRLPPTTQRQIELNMRSK
jgi:hypothetical protein